MGFSLQERKGIHRCLVDEGIDPQRLRFHISEVAPGTSSHPPHAHSGIEAFYLLEGHGTVEVGRERYELGPNEAILLDAARPHGLRNSGTTRMRYLVIMCGS